METTTISALIIDDSALYRKFVASVLSEIPGVVVVGTATNGRIGLEKIRTLEPELITLDLEMPEVDGLGVLEELAARKTKVASIVVSSTTAEGASATTKALRLGAFDFVLKPSGKSPDDSRRQLASDLAPKICAIVDTIERSRKSGSSPQPASDLPTIQSLSQRSATSVPPEIVAIGVSTGGPIALQRVLPLLPADFPCPMVIVQHMPPMFTKTLADDLDQRCALWVTEATDGHVIKAGQVLIAPGGRQMRLANEGGTAVVRITDDPPERSCKPSVDYLFRSLAHQFGRRAVGVILTGMGDDGTLGCKLLKRMGATIVAQDEQTCTVYGMPRSVIEAGLPDCIVPLDEIATCLMEITSPGVYA